MDAKEYFHILEKMEEAVRIGAEIITKRSHSSELIKKGLADYATGTDLLVQQTIQDNLKEIIPEVAFMGEEQENHEVPIGEAWILDPIDGTTNFMHDYRHSAISLAYVKDGDPEIGVIYQPYTDEMFTAVINMGAYLNGKLIHVSEINDLKESLIAVGTCPYNREYADETFDRMKRIFLSCMDVRRNGSAALDLAYVACGRYEAYIERQIKAWDYAAGMLIVKEAGGKVYDLEGELSKIKVKSPMIATNGKIDIKMLL